MRRGATLTEVLMAILILGVGVVSVFALFPISVLRAIQATQNTNSKILLVNVQDAVSATPLVLDMNAPPFASAGALPAEFRGHWRPTTDYTVGDIVVPSVKSGSPFPSPHFWFQCSAASNDPASSGPLEPLWNTSGTTIDCDEDIDGDGTLDPNEDANGNGFLDFGEDANGNGFLDNEDLNGNGRLDQVAWAPVAALTIDATTGQPDSTAGNPVVSALNYVVDPLGWATAFAEPGLIPINEFGCNYDESTGVVSSVWTAGDLTTAPMLRSNGGYPGLIDARLATTLPDSWEEVLAATPASTLDVDQSTTPATVGVVTFPPTTDLSGIGIGQGWRITLTSSDGTKTFTRPITAVDPVARTVSWSGQLPAPALWPDRVSGPPDELTIGMARVEYFDRRYSWLMTVKKFGGKADVKVAVIFKRSLTAADEHVYASNFSNQTIDLDGDGIDDATQHGLGGRTDWVKITWSAAEPEPLTKPGNFLFDARDAEWYRIREVYDRDDADGYAVLILDRTVMTITPDDGSGVPSVADPAGRTMLMRGVIDVYDL